MVFVKYSRAASGNVSVQVVRKHGGVWEVVRHVGSARTDFELARLHVDAYEFLESLESPVLPLVGVQRRFPSAPRMDEVGNYRSKLADGGGEKVVSSVGKPAGSAGVLVGSTAGVRGRVYGTFNLLTWQLLSAAWDHMDFGIRDEAFKDAVIVRVVRPISKAKVPEVVKSLRADAFSSKTIHTAMQRCVDRQYDVAISRACHRYVRQHHQVTMVLYDVTTLYCETATEDNLRKMGMSKEHRKDPQIVVGLVTDRTGFPLHVEFFHGRTAETTTLLPALKRYIDTHDLAHVVVVADAAMLSAKNLTILEENGIDYIVADRLRKAPYTVLISDDDLEEWSQHTGEYAVVESIKDMRFNNQTITRRTVLGFSPKRYKYDMFVLDKNKQRAQAVINGNIRPKQVRFVKNAGGQYVINEEAFDKAQALAGWKGYVTSLNKNQVTGTQIIEYYHDLWHIEQAFRMAKTDLKARPMYHYKPEKIKAHLTLVHAALALSRHLYLITGLPAKTIVEKLQPYRHAQITFGEITQLIPPELPQEITTLTQTITNWKKVTKNFQSQGPK